MIQHLVSYCLRFLQGSLSNCTTYHGFSTETEAIHIRQRDDFVKLDLQLRNLVTAIADGESRMTCLLIQQGDSIRDHVTAEAASIRLGHDSILTHVTTEVTNLKTAIFDEAKHLGF